MTLNKTLKTFSEISTTNWKILSVVVIGAICKEGQNQISLTAPFPTSHLYLHPVACMSFLLKLFSKEQTPLL